MERVGVEDELLRAGRALAACHAGGLAGAAGVRRGGAAAGAVRGSHRGGAGGARRGAAGRRAPRPAPPIVRVPARTGALPLSFAQQRLWVVDRLEPGSAAYNMPVALRLRGALDAARAAGQPGRAGAAARGAAHGLRGARAARPCRWSIRPPRCRCRRWTCGLPAGGARAAGASAWRARRRCGPSTWRGGRCCGARCCAWATGTTCSASRCTTSSATAGACEVLVREVSALYAAFSRGEEPRAARAAGAVRRLRRVAARVARRARCWRSSVGYWKERAGRRPAAAGASHGPPARGGAEPRARASHPFALPPEAVGGAAGALAARGRDAVHDACSPAGRRCWGAGRGRRTWWWAPPSRGGPGAETGGADRLLRQHAARCAPTCRAIPPGASCWGGCGRRRWGRTSTRSSPSSAWWRSWAWSAAWRTRPSSRRPSP